MWDVNGGGSADVVDYTAKVSAELGMVDREVAVDEVLDLSIQESARHYCASEWQLFVKIVLPASIPYIMAGVRLCVGLAIIGMIVAEFFTAITGLGGLIIRAPADQALSGKPGLHYRATRETDK